MNWDYIAGFFDGEGSVIFGKNTIKLQFSNTDKTTLTKIHKFLGCGNVRFYYRNPDKWKSQGVLMIGKYEEVLPILKKLENKCIIKKEKIQKALNYYKNKKWLFIKVDMKKLKLLRKKGFPLRIIGSELGISRETARRRLKTL